MPETENLNKIFRAYDIRGIYPDEINEEVVFKIAVALVKFLNPDKLIVAKDDRKSSETLMDLVITAITASGVDVIDIGSAGSPLFYFAVNRLGAAGGVMITASHNPPQYNGLKLVREKAIPIGGDSGLLQIKNLVKDSKIERIRKGRVIKKDLGNEYKAYLLKKAGFSVEPAPDKNLKFEFDADQDRLFVYEKNKEIRADLLGGVIIRDFLETCSFFRKVLGRPKFVYDLRFSKSIPEYIEENGGTAIRSRVGHSFMKHKMRSNRAVFGAELANHFYFKDVYYSEAPILMKLKILKIMNENKKLLSELVSPFQKYFHSGKININIPPATLNIQNLFQELKEIYKDGKIDELDGITIEYANWWFNLRPSNTEPVLRLVVEAEAQYLMEQKVKEITELIRQFSV